jgi:alginate O-acetyltransferase complex protein AlgI
VGVGLNVSLLGIFKYVVPFAEQTPITSWEVGFFQQIVVPLGVSFWTFQGLSYLFDLYREEELDPTLLEFFLYMAFWPTVLSGPVCRLPKMLPQFRHRPTSSIGEDFSVGAVRIIQGLFMKMVLAQLLSSGLTPDGGVTAGFDGIAPGRSGLDVWALAIGYGFQLFFDFAGYSNIVIGAARLLGIRLEENFNRPYLSLTPSMFWTRWHMSLSFWIRDYVFLPLATVRRDPWWPYAALVCSMVIFGFWHGANFTYVAWGLYHGLLLLGHRVGQRVKKRIPFKLPYSLGALLSWGSTFLLVSLSYILFRANDLGQALHMLRAVIAPRSYALVYATLPRDYYYLVALMVVGYFAYVGLAQLLVLWTTCYREKLSKSVPSPTARIAGWATLSGVVLSTDDIVAEKKWWWLTPVLALLLMVTTISYFGRTSNIAPFIYTLF